MWILSLMPEADSYTPDRPADSLTLSLGDQYLAPDAFLHEWPGFAVPITIPPRITLSLLAGFTYETLAGRVISFNAILAEAVAGGIGPTRQHKYPATNGFQLDMTLPGKIENDTDADKPVVIKIVIFGAGPNVRMLEDMGWLQAMFS